VAKILFVFKFLSSLFQMAKVIRNCWVYKKDNRWFRYLPRRNDGWKEYDFEKYKAMPSDFNQPMEVDEPPKLWVVWICRGPEKEPNWTKERMKQLFGEDGWDKHGKIHVFKNTASMNDLLWHVKHIIDIRPMSFPNGEPTAADIPYTEVLPDGRCVVDREHMANPNEVQVMDPKKQFGQGYLYRMLKRRYNAFKDIYPDTVYNPKNVTVID
jgi:hypothetical protein